MRRLKYFLILTLIIVFISFNTTSAAVSSWERGASIVPVSAEDLSSENTRQALMKLKETGSNQVSFVVNYFQSNLYSSDIQRGWNTPSDSSLISAINYAHSIGLDVSLKMHLETFNGDWRAHINPSDRDSWYQNYSNMLNHYGALAEDHDVEEIIIGTELISVASHQVNPDNTVRWKNMISSLRDVYSGTLSYSANWGANSFEEELSKIEFWDDLDYIGISAYYPLNTANNVNDMKAVWSSWHDSRIKPVYDRWNKPIRFTEIGYRSTNVGYTRPWDWWSWDPYDGSTQANAYEALFSYWNDVSYFNGVTLWQWESNPSAGGEGNTNYTPQNKPAELVMKQWFGGLGEGGEISYSIIGTDKNGSISSPITVEITVQNEGVEVQDRIIDIEIFKDGGRVHQEYIEWQDFMPDESKNYSTTFTPASEGVYKVMVGIFDRGWRSLELWEDQAAKIIIGNTTPPPPPDDEDLPEDDDEDPPPPDEPAGEIDIWWPTNGATVSGLQPFKAMLQNKDISQYDMFWQVDGDRLNDMHDDHTDWPHKEALVDLTGWNWKGTGPYNINFIAKDKNGAEIKSKSVDINIVQ